MAMHITGYEGREAIPYAIKPGVALQLTNILRDVGDDWRIGRIYLPLEDLHTFQLTEDDIAAGVVDHGATSWRSRLNAPASFLRRIIARNCLLGKRDASPLLRAAELYRAILIDDKPTTTTISPTAHILTNNKIAPPARHLLAYVAEDTNRSSGTSCSTNYGERKSCLKNNHYW